jgi:hypothetical protein
MICRDRVKLVSLPIGFVSRLKALAQRVRRREHTYSFARTFALLQGMAFTG